MASEYPADPASFHVARPLAIAQQMELWHSIMWRFNSELAKQPVHIARAISSVASEIRADYPHSLHAYHESAISKLYVSAILNVGLNQTKLVGLIESMMSQNDDLNIKLSLSVWNAFFAQYFRSKNELNKQIDVWIFLGSMDGDMVLPTLPSLKTIEIVCRGITRNNGIVIAETMAISLADSIARDHRLAPSNAIIKEQFRMARQQHNTEHTTELLLSHPDIRFHPVTADTFNDVLTHLGMNIEDDAFPAKMVYLLNVLIPIYNPRFQLDTYQMIRTQCARYPWIYALQMIRSHLYRGHVSASEVLRRLGVVDHIKEGWSYQTFNQRFPGCQIPEAPTGPLMFCSRCEWRRQTNTWIAKLLKNKKYIDRPHTQRDLVQSMQSLCKTYCNGSYVASCMWSRFFHRFYHLKSEFGCEFVWDLLSMMQNEESRPTLLLFDEIIIAISTNKHMSVSDRSKLQKYIADVVMPVYNLTTSIFLPPLHHVQSSLLNYCESS